MRALNEVLGEELQPKELLLEAKKRRRRMRSQVVWVQVERQAVLQPGGRRRAPKRLRDENKWLGKREEQQTGAGIKQS